MRTVFMWTHFISFSEQDKITVHSHRGRESIYGNIRFIVLRGSMRPLILYKGPYFSPIVQCIPDQTATHTHTQGQTEVYPIAGFFCEVNRTMNWLFPAR